MLCPKCQSRNHPKSPYCTHCGLSFSEQYVRQETSNIADNRALPHHSSQSHQTSLYSSQNPLEHLLQSGGILEGKFQLRQEIGRGGMGHVYAGVDLSLGREVAIKVLPPHYNEDQAVVARFRREARAMASLDHPNIVTVYSIGHDAHLHYFVMKLLQGETLAHELKRQEIGQHVAFTSKDVIELLIQVCNGLDHAHQKSLLHRDIKPGNLMVNEDRKLTIMDFGIVKRLDETQDTIGLKTAHGKIFGTPEYMPPEQAMGKGEYSPASDIYALAVVGYEMICGEIPFKGETPIEIILQHIRSEPPPFVARGVGKNSILEAIFRKAMAKKPLDRYTSATHFQTALLGALQSEHKVNLHPVSAQSMAEQNLEMFYSQDSSANNRPQPYSPSNPLNSSITTEHKITPAHLTSQDAKTDVIPQDQLIKQNTTPQTIGFDEIAQSQSPQPSHLSAAFRPRLSSLQSSNTHNPFNHAP